MVGSFRQSGVGQVVIGLVVAMIIGAFVLGGGAMGAAGWSKECAAEVGDHCVDPKEYYAAYGLMSSIGLNEKAAKQLQLRAQIAEGLVERELLLEEAKRLGILRWWAASLVLSFGVGIATGIPFFLLARERAVARV